MNRRGQPRQFSFPLLRIEDIVACLNELEIDVTAEDIKKPKPATARLIYTKLIEHAMTITKDEMNQPIFSGLGSLGHPELHEDSVPVLAFFRNFSKLMRASGVFDNGVGDIAEPDARRFVRNLSAVINFAKFREEKIGIYQEVTDAGDALQEQKDRLEDENAALAQQIQDLRRQRAEEQPAVAAMKQECAALEGEINVCNKQQAMLKYDAQELKKTIKSLSDAAGDTQFQTLSVEQECEKLQNGIVTSPERHKAELRALADRLRATKEDAGDVDAAVIAVQAKLEAQKKVEREIKKTLALMAETGEALEECRRETRAAKDKKARIDNHAHAMEELASQRAHVRKQAEAADAKRKRLRGQRDVKETAAGNALRDARGELTALEEARVAALAEAEGCEADAVRTAAARKRAADAHARGMAEKDAQVATFAAALRGYHAKLLAAMAQQGEDDAAAAAFAEEEAEAYAEDAVDEEDEDGGIEEDGIEDEEDDGIGSDVENDEHGAGPLGGVGAAAAGTPLPGTPGFPSAGSMMKALQEARQPPQPPAQAQARQPTPKQPTPKAPTPKAPTPAPKAATPKAPTPAAPTPASELPPLPPPEVAFARGSKIARTPPGGWAAAR